MTRKITISVKTITQANKGTNIFEDKLGGSTVSGGATIVTVGPAMTVVTTTVARG